jgi:hypothetical protein
LVQEFTHEDGLEAGAWDTRFARVLAKAVVDTSAVAVVAADGPDGGVVHENIETFVCAERIGTWQPSSGGWGAGWSGGIADAGDRGVVGEKVVVEFRRKVCEVEVQPSGYSVFVARAVDPRAPRGGSNDGRAWGCGLPSGSSQRLRKHLHTCRSPD